MNRSSREAADQLVRLTRLVIRAGGAAEAAPRSADGYGGVRILRHNRAELTPLEQHVMGQIVQGRCTDLLAGLLELPRCAVDDHLTAVLRDFRLPADPPPGPPHDRDGRSAPVAAGVLVGGEAGGAGRR
ncbi:hypothetical protein [Actinomadura macrotermitis]|uniref:Uncharacterized protein n=1 Tax=Actinomadura macrotermitis TaxID=2585200 RepID=A0A7K0C6U6_9ACTN|nr:hypothetical protein [Actinomadura macrotermitis]MQY09155.1 hypothetical protein [Actinomadura macrotermitis]